MNLSHRLPTEIAEALARGSTVVTGNQRAARTLRLEFDRVKRASGQTRWRPPEIYAWDTWTASLWRQLLLDGRVDRLLLNRSQEIQVWSSIIGADAQWSSLQTLESLAVMAADAWKLLCQYCGQQRLRSIGLSGDTRTFQRWAQAFVRRCQTDSYLPQAELEETLTRFASGLAAAGTHRPGPVCLVGFDRLAPAQIAFLNTLRGNGVPIEEVTSGVAAEHTLQSVTDDLSGELSQAATWIGQFLEKNPQAQVAVIAPNLGEERGNIECTFRAILAPELQDITASTAARPFEFSLGRPLAQSPMIAVAMGLARWINGPLSSSDITRTLLSPYFAGNREEQAARAEFDASEFRRLRLLQPELGLERFIEHVAQARRAGRLGGLLGQLRALHRTASKLLPAPESASQQKPWSDWADTIRQLLSAAGWAIRGQLDSVEFQTREKWEGALDELATLDFEGSRVTYAEALTVLEGLLKRTLFAPESQGAPVQIMSPQEAAGSRFDAIYFLRASDVNWPVRPGFSPLLGWRLQRELGMPGSDAARDHEHSRRMTARLVASAETVIFSYATETAQGRQRPSPLLNEFDLKSIEPSTQPGSEPVTLEPVDESFVPVPGPSVRGGAELLKLQAACGFRAFAEKRLWSTELKARDPGMDAGKRGEIVHKALEHFWGEVLTQAALRALSGAERREQLDRSIEYGLSEIFRLRAREGEDPWSAAYRESQRRRLQYLLSRWLAEELERAPFEVVLREANFEDVAIGPLLLDIRVDRVDRLLDGPSGEVLIDYKTSNSTPSDWRDERPNEPQLPLYAAVREPGTVAGVAFARVRPGKDMALTGLEADKGLLPTGTVPKPTLTAQIEDWKRILITLAEEFAAGDARVDPKQYPATCKYCAQRTLCRLDPAKLQGEFDEDQDFYLEGLYVGDNG